LRLSYTPKALAELDEMLAFIAERSPQGARSVQQRLQTVIGLLPRHPYAGQRASEPRLRRLVATPHPYVVFYEVTETEVIIIGVRHAARDPSAGP
jgi:plasmid stabilization system protein ParE